MLSLHHQPETWWLWVELNHQPRAYETLALIRLSYTAVWFLEARGGVEPRAFPPSSQRFGLEDRCRERGPWSLPISDCQMPIES